MPGRPLISSMNAINSGAEGFLLKLIKPIFMKSKYVLHSTKQFTNEFQNFQKISDKNNVEICSFDAKSLYTNICVDTVVTYISNEIYRKYYDFLTRIF